MIRSTLTLIFLPVFFCCLSSVGYSMDDKTALLAAVHGRPDDDTPRLVFADYVDDYDSQLAKFIRESIEDARLDEIERRSDYATIIARRESLKRRWERNKTKWINYLNPPLGEFLKSLPRNRGVPPNALVIQPIRGFPGLVDISNGDPEISHLLLATLTNHLGAFFHPTSTISHLVLGRLSTSYSYGAEASPFSAALASIPAEHRNTLRSVELAVTDPAILFQLIEAAGPDVLQRLNVYFRSCDEAALRQLSGHQNLANLHDLGVAVPWARDARDTERWGEGVAPSRGIEIIGSSARFTLESFGYSGGVSADQVQPENFDGPAFREIQHLTLEHLRAHVSLPRSRTIQGTRLRTLELGFVSMHQPERFFDLLPNHLTRFTMNFIALPLSGNAARALGRASARAVFADINLQQEARLFSFYEGLSNGEPRNLIHLRLVGDAELEEAIEDTDSLVDLISKAPWAKRLVSFGTSALPPNLRRVIARRMPTTNLLLGNGEEVTRYVNECDKAASKS